VTRKTAEEKKKRFAEKALPHMNAMYAVALRMTGNDKEAEDLVQDGLLRAFRFFDRFEEGTNLKAWLMKVMTNIFLNRLKKYSRRPVMVEFEVVEELIGTAEDEAAGISSADEDFRDHLEDAVAGALDELPTEYRVPVLLSAIDGLSYREIAETMHCPVGTVMSRLYRGRRMLERRLKTYALERGLLKGRGE
jgi:RNA polymerase sigma-70 factor (ECF subfamily)